MTVNDPAKVFSIGSIVGGATLANRGWVDAIRALTRQVALAREGVESAANVNVEFHVAGNILTPQFEGVRTGAFRKRDNLLKVQIALPMVAPEHAMKELLGALDAALDAADAWALIRRQQFDTAPIRSILAALRESDQ